MTDHDVRAFISGLLAPQSPVQPSSVKKGGVSKPAKTAAGKPVLKKMSPAKFKYLCALSEKAMADDEEKSSVVLQESVTAADYKKLPKQESTEFYYDQERRATAYGSVSVKLGDDFKVDDPTFLAGNRVLSEQDVQGLEVALKEYLNTPYTFGTGSNSDDFKYECSSSDMEIIVKLRCVAPHELTVPKPEAAVALRAVFRYGGYTSDNAWKPIASDIDRFCTQIRARVRPNVMREAFDLYMDTAPESYIL